MAIWLDKQLILAIHDRQLAEHSGASGVRDDQLLESALGRPRQLYAYGESAPDLAGLAATVAYGLVRNHPFVDGNKRTAAVACELFIEQNGSVLTATDAEFYLQIMALAEGSLDAEAFADWLRTYLPPGREDSIQEPRSDYV